MNVIGYSRVSTSDQEDNGHGLDAQERRIREACDQRGWQLVEIVREGASGKDLRRDGLQGALQRLARGEADGLVVAKMDRLSRSLIDFALLLDWFRDARVALVALDFDLDTSTPTGELMAQMLMAVAQWERRAIGARTKDALGVLRAAGRPVNQGAVADRPDLVARIRDLRAEDKSLREICGVLESEGWATVRQGARWHPSALQAVLGYERRSARRLAVLPTIRGGRT